MLNVAFWNLGNLFDTKSDPIANDLDFRPDQGWTAAAQRAKVANLARVIDEMFGGAGPDVLGVCEVENNATLQQLVDAITVSDKLEIAAVTDDSDLRGIDCALVIRKDKLGVVQFDPDVDGEPPATSHVVHNRFPTRDVLEVALEVKATGAELIVYVNHWPSRSRGAVRDRTTPDRGRESCRPTR